MATDTFSDHYCYNDKYNLDISLAGKPRNLLQWWGRRELSTHCKERKEWKIKTSENLWECGAVWHTSQNSMFVLQRQSSEQLWVLYPLNS